MLNKPRGILAGVMLAVLLSLSVGLTVAQEEPPPVRPADVEAQASRTLWNQIDSVVEGGSTVASYILSPEWALAADDFVVTETQVPPVTYTAWIVSQVVVRASVDWTVSPGPERASICFYGDAGEVPAASALACFNGLAAAWSVEGDDLLQLYRVLTYTLSANPLFFTGTRNWLSVQMSGVGAAWYWRARSNATPFPGTKAFAFMLSSGFQPFYFSPACRGQWQAQSGPSSRCTGYQDWPAGHDLSFKLVGSPFYGVLSPRAYLPLVRR